MKKNQPRSTVLVLSGGLDSLVLAHKLASEKGRFRGLYINFGKAVSRNEIAVAKRLSLDLHFPLEIVNLPGLTDMQLGNVSNEYVARDEADIKGEPTVGDEQYVSGFQMLLGIASYYAQITGNSSMTLGIIKDQFDKYPKLRNVFSKFEEMTNLLNPNLDKFSIELPFTKISKAEVIKLGTNLGASLDRSWTCLLGGDSHCGKCSQCISRKGAFKSAKIKDPTNYQK
jgi:7-cyano-7-deazaguanine synthase